MTDSRAGLLTPQSTVFSQGSWGGPGWQDPHPCSQHPTEGRKLCHRLVEHPRSLDRPQARQEIALGRSASGVGATVWTEPERGPCGGSRRGLSADPKHTAAQPDELVLKPSLTPSTSTNWVPSVYQTAGPQRRAVGRASGEGMSPDTSQAAMEGGTLPALFTAVSPALATVVSYLWNGWMHACMDGRTTPGWTVSLIPVLLSPHTTAGPGWTPPQLAAPLATPPSQEVMLQLSLPTILTQHKWEYLWYLVLYIGKG